MLMIGFRCSKSLLQPGNRQVCMFIAVSERPKPQPESVLLSSHADRFACCSGISFPPPPACCPHSARAANVSPIWSRRFPAAVLIGQSWLKTGTAAQGAPPDAASACNFAMLLASRTPAHSSDGHRGRKPGKRHGSGRFRHLAGSGRIHTTIRALQLTSMAHRNRTVRRS